MKPTIPQEEPKQETLEEAAKNTTSKYINEREKQTAYLEFIEGSKWQSEITENIACEFAEFISNHRLDFQPSTLGRFIGLDMKSYTAKELFKEYLKTKENEAKIHLVK
jgi:hypothetical protein